MTGGAGDDVLLGNGAARLYGDEGHDIFLFANPSGGSDRARDFDVKDDVVGLSRAMFTADVKVGFLGDAYFRVGKAAETPSEFVLYDKKSGAFSLDQDGSGPLAPVEIGLLPDHLKLKANPNYSREG
jgi:Ca2+-binding RTX toxin-like protein